MAFSGNIEDLSLIDVLQLISQSAKTGILHVTSNNVESKIYLKEGKLIEVKSGADSIGDKLGLYLLNKDLITKEQLNILLEKQKKMPIRLGTLLIKEKILTKETLKQFIMEVTKEKFLQIISIESGQYHFEPTIVEFNPDEFTPIDLNNILLDVLKDLDEIKLFRSKIHSLEIVYSKKKTSDEVVIDDQVTDNEPVVIEDGLIKLNKKSYMIYSRIDGTNNINDIIVKTGYPEHFVLKTFFILYNEKKIEIVNKNIIKEPISEKNNFVELIINITIFLLAFIFLYSIFGYYQILSSDKLYYKYKLIHNENIKECQNLVKKIYKIEKIPKSERILIYDKIFIKD
jgi:hypothetical protein